MAALERQEGEKINQEDGACSFLHAPVNFTVETVVEHMLHWLCVCVYVCVDVCLSVSTFVLFRLFPFIIQDRFMNVVLEQ